MNDLVLIHGWGTHSAIFEPIVPLLSAHFRVHVLDLPGTGDAPLLGTFTQATLISYIVNSLPPNAIVCGWSLGGLLSLLCVHKHPSLIKALVLIGATPRFVQDTTWQAGIDTAQFNLFEASIDDNFSNMMSDFLTLQTRTSQLTPSARKALIDKVCAKPPCVAHLKYYLHLLKTLDMRLAVTQLKLPLLTIFGKYDALIPAHTHTQIKKLNPLAEYELITKAAHAPFLSQPCLFTDILCRFYDRHFSH